MLKKDIPGREAAMDWVGRCLSETPTKMVQRTEFYMPGSWIEVTRLVSGSRVYLDGLGAGMTGTVTDCDEETHTYKICLDDGREIEAAGCDVDLADELAFPAWDTMWSFKERLDQDWLACHLREASECKFRVFYSDEFGYYFGTDDTEDSLIEEHFIQLCQARGSMRYDPDMDVSAAGQPSVDTTSPKKEQGEGALTISLKKAFELCLIGDREVVHLCTDKERSQRVYHPMTGKEVRERYDMRTTMVTGIDSYFCCGEYEGFLFTIKEEGK